MEDQLRGRNGTLVAAARVVSIAEAVSFLLLLVATAVKYGADQPAGVKVLGPLHGGLFIAYCVLVLAVAAGRRWPVVRTLLALGASVLPVAPLLVERAWLRQQEPASEASIVGHASARGAERRMPAGDTGEDAAADGEQEAASEASVVGHASGRGSEPI